MITTDNMYERYVYDNNIALLSLREEIISLRKDRAFLISRLKTYEGNLLQVNLPFSSIVNRSSKVQYGNSIECIKDPNILTYLYVLLEINSRLNKVINKIRFIEGKLINIAVYKKIVRKFNQKCITWMLRGGFHLRVKNIGVIKPLTKENRGEVKRVDWGKSNKVKQAIINSGGTPYQTIRNEKGEIVGNNGGEKWVTMVSNRFDTWWYWGSPNHRITNIELYSFAPAKDTKTALRDVLNSDSSAYLKFQR